MELEREMMFETEVGTQVKNDVDQNTVDHKEEDEPKILIVYEYSPFEKYIDMSSAFELGLVSYEYYTTHSGFLYEVSDAMISEWEKMGIKIQCYRVSYNEPTHGINQEKVDYLKKLKEKIQNSDINITNFADDVKSDDDLGGFKK